jgi:hypothetical protein
MHHFGEAYTGQLFDGVPAVIQSPRFAVDQRHGRCVDKHTFQTFVNVLQRLAHDAFPARLDELSKLRLAALLHDGPATMRLSAAVIASMGAITLSPALKTQRF